MSDVVFKLQKCWVSKTDLSVRITEITTGQGTVAVLCAGKVTVGLALHKPSVTGSVIYPPTG